MLFNKRLELVKEFHEWAQNANKDIRVGQIDENDFGTFIAFLEIKGLINEKAVVINDFIERVKKYYTSEKISPLYDKKHPYGKHTLIPSLFSILDKIGDDIVKGEK